MSTRFLPVVISVTGINNHRTKNKVGSVGVLF
jgi:hypothetical protein